MKSFYCIFFGLLLSDYSNASSSQFQADSDVRSRLDNAIEQAKKRKDYRLLGMQSNNMALPGVTSESAAQHIKHCGIKRVKQVTSSNIAPQQQQQQAFTSLYNQQILRLCQQEQP